jgi:hypothetical protein
MCRFWGREAIEAYVLGVDDDGTRHFVKDAECRRNAPIATKTRWPRTWHDDWCGEWKPKK